MIRKLDTCTFKIESGFVKKKMKPPKQPFDSCFRSHFLAFPQEIKHLSRKMFFLQNKLFEKFFFCNVNVFYFEHLNCHEYKI